MSFLPGIIVSLIVSLDFISKFTIKRNEYILYVNSLYEID